MFEYPKVCSDLLDDLPGRTKDVILKRFGLKEGIDQRETLESIGKSYQITRERVRQIEKEGLKKLKRKMESHEDVFEFLNRRINEFGGLKREDRLLNILGGEDNQNYVKFLLSLGESLERKGECEDFHPFWVADKEATKKAQEIIKEAKTKLKNSKKPVPLEYLKTSPDYPTHVFISYLEISKVVSQGPQGLYGLREWPEVTPRGVKDRAYIALRRKKKPLHFKEVADFIGESSNPQTVHNELIKDSRFVLVGRGVYALREWGYEPGEVKDVIKRVIKRKKRPLSKEEIIEEVLKERLVKENTIIQNLSNKKHFKRTSDGHYTTRDTRAN